jgi:PmbA protein
VDLLTRLRVQADQVEVVEIEEEAISVGFEAGKLTSSKAKETKGAAVRVLKDGRLGFAASSDESATEKLVANVLASAAQSDRVSMTFPPPASGPDVKTFDPTIAGLSIPRLVEMGREIIELILEKEPDARVRLDLNRGVHQISIRNHAGADIAIRRSPLSLSYVITRVRGDDVLTMWGTTGATVWEDDYALFARRVGRKLELAQETASGEAGRMPVLFSPNGAAVLVHPLMPGLNGKNLYTNASPIGRRLGEKLFDDAITLADDPTIDGRFASAPYDDEGIPHRRNLFIERGRLRGFYCDLKTAAQLGIEPTGNGSRTLFSPPRPSPTNVILEPGTTPVTEMIGGLERGLLVEDALGQGQGNVISGAFSNTLSLAFRIEKGEIVGRVKDVSIAGNVYDLLQDVAAVSRESEWVDRTYVLPYILLPEVSVSTR